MNYKSMYAPDKDFQTLTSRESTAKKNGQKNIVQLMRHCAPPRAVGLLFCDPSVPSWVMRIFDNVHEASVIVFVARLLVAPSRESSLAPVPASSSSSPVLLCARPVKRATSGREPVCCPVDPARVREPVREVRTRLE